MTQSAQDLAQLLKVSSARTSFFFDKSGGKAGSGNATAGTGGGGAQCNLWTDNSGGANHGLTFGPGGGGGGPGFNTATPGNGNAGTQGIIIISYNPWL
ncbi:MAG: hypothetical protein JSR78_07815 [Proteobacteria bacterium]|nr:hypothetical protein [Pseudomonadota bacterium]